MTPTEHVEVIYCDDIRQEVGGKQSLMGVYTGDMIVSEVPVTLPKLGILATVICPVERVFEYIEVRLEKDDETLVTSGKVRTSDVTVATSSDDSLKHFAMGFAFLLSPVLVEKPITLRIVVDTDRGQLRGRALRIQVPSPTDKREANTPATSSAH